MRHFFTLILFFLSSTVLFGQNYIHPEVQKEIDLLNLWIQKQISEGNEINQEELNAKNKRIRMIQDEIKNQQDSSLNSFDSEGRRIQKTAIPGSVFTVPDGVVWKIEGIYLKSFGQPYKIKVDKQILEELYEQGEEIRLPSWTVEFHLLDLEMESLNFELEITEFEY